jgi:hypothetical protein
MIKKKYVIVSPKRTTTGTFAGNLETKNNLNQANLNLLLKEVNLIKLTEKPYIPQTAPPKSYTQMAFPSLYSEHQGRRRW